MRLTSLKHWVICAIALTFTLHTFADDAEYGIEAAKEKVPGYVIEKDGQKVEGYVVPGTITDNEVKVTFYAGTSNKKKVYKPGEIEGYGYFTSEEDEFGLTEESWTHYESMIADVPPKPFASTNVFMEREIEGEVTLYTYYIEVRNDVSKPFKYEYYLKDQSGSMQKITKSDFDKTTRQIFQDYTALSSRIGQKDFGYRQLDRMVRDYNYWMENQHDRSEYRVAMKTN